MQLNIGVTETRPVDSQPSLARARGATLSAQTGMASSTSAAVITGSTLSRLPHDTLMLACSWSTRKDLLAIRGSSSAG